MLTPALAEQRRPQAFREREARAAKRKKKTLTRPSWKTQAGRGRADEGQDAPAFLPDPGADVMVMEPLYVSARPPGLAAPADMSFDPLRVTATPDLSARLDARFEPSLLPRLEATAINTAVGRSGHRPGAANSGPSDREPSYDRPSGAVAKEIDKKFQAAMGDKAERDERSKKGEKVPDARRRQDASGTEDDKEREKDKAGEEKEGEEKDGRKAPGDKSKAETGVAGARKAGKPAASGGRLAGIKDDRPAFIAMPLPRAETGPVPLSRQPLAVRDPAPLFEAPLYLRHRSMRDPQPLPSELTDYASRFAAASGLAHRLYENVLSQAHMLNVLMRSAEDRRAGHRQRSLDRALARLGESLAEARGALAGWHFRNLAALDQAVFSARLSIRRTASRGVGALRGRAASIDGALGSFEGRRSDILAMPGKKAAEVDGAYKQTVEGLDALAANPGRKLRVQEGLTKPAMLAAQQEALERDIHFPVAEAKLDLPTQVASMKTGLQAQVPPLTSSLCQAFCPFESFRKTLRDDAVTAVAKAQKNSLEKLDEAELTARDTVERTFNETEVKLIEHHNQLRGRLIEAARQREDSERKQAEQQGMRDASTLGAIAAAPSKAVSAIDALIAQRRGEKEEPFARAVISYSDGLAKGGLDSARQQARQTGEAADAATDRIDRGSMMANDMFVDGVRLPASQLSAIADQTGETTTRMIADVDQNMAKLSDPIRDTVASFLDSVNSKFPKALASLNETLSTSRKNLMLGFDGKPPMPPANTGAAGEPDKCQTACKKAEKKEDQKDNRGQGEE